MQKRAPKVSELKSVCVYCGSSPGKNHIYMETGRRLGKRLADEGIDLVFGGGDVGVMGAVANATVDAGGRVTGIIPRFLRDVEIPSERIQELIITETMHERKALMYERSDAFVVLPGGIGTLEEVIEMISWAQLNQHSKPIILVSIEDYWTPFFALLDHVVAHGYARPDIRRVWRTVKDVEDILPAIREWMKGEEAETVPKF